MYRLTGQKSTNWFENNLSNHVSYWPNTLEIKTLVEKFSGYDRKPSVIGLSSMGKYTQEGKQESNIKVPFSLIFQPNPALSSVGLYHLI